MTTLTTSEQHGVRLGDRITLDGRAFLVMVVRSETRLRVIEADAWGLLVVAAIQLWQRLVFAWRFR